MKILRSDRVFELLRYYQAGVINTLFGLGLYSALIALGVNMFVAQLLSHIAGVTFNYATYSRHVFRAAGQAKARFIISYTLNYLAGLAALAAVSQFIANPYEAGFLSTFIVSIGNYFALKLLVFRERTS